MQEEESEIARKEQAAEDADWVARAQRGDMSAFDRLVRRHNGRVFGIAYHMVGHREDAEDIAQAVFIKAYQSLGKFRGQSAFSSWLHRIAVNETYNHLKKRKKMTYQSLAEMNPTDPDDPAHDRLSSLQNPSTELSLKDLQKNLNDALQSLSNAHRTAVVLHEIDGLPHEEIAGMLGCSVGTVRSRLFYARKELQKRLAKALK